MTTEHSMNGYQTKPGHVGNAESHAYGCWMHLEQHCAGGTRCGCRIDVGTSFPTVQVADGCAIGQALTEEYEIASRRVRELRAAEEAGQRDLEYGDLDLRFKPRVLRITVIDSHGACLVDLDEVSCALLAAIDGTPGTLVREFSSTSKIRLVVSVVG